MADQNMDWQTRLAVSYTDANNNDVDITPIDAFSPSFALNADVLHSIEDTHIGVIFNPKAVSFTMTVKAIGDVAAQLTAIAFEGQRFSITLQESGDGLDWSFKTIVLSSCIITSASTNAPVTGAPTATFSGVSLHAKEEPKTGTAVEIPG
jgi:hypothetical protein